MSSGIKDFSCISKAVIYSNEFVKIVGQDIFGEFTNSLPLFVVYAKVIVIFNLREGVTFRIFRFLITVLSYVVFIFIHCNSLVARVMACHSKKE